MARSIGDDELATGCREIAVGNVDRDTLLTLSAEPIGEIGEIDLSSAGDVGGTLKGLNLILHERLGVVEEAADKGRLAVIDGPAGIEAEEVDGMSGSSHGESPRNIRPFSGPPSRPRRPCRLRGNRAR